MKRPDTPSRPSKYRKSSPATGLKRPPPGNNLDEEAELKWLEDRYAFVESWQVLNGQFEERALHSLLHLLADMTAGVRTHGALIDDAIQGVLPERYRDYVRMWLQANQFVLEVPFDDATWEASVRGERVQHAEKVAWRIWQCKVRSGEQIDERALYGAIHSEQQAETLAVDSERRQAGVAAKRDELSGAA